MTETQLSPVRVDVFGGVRASVDGVTVDTPGLRAELLLALLTLARHEPVSIHELTGWLWGSEPPSSAVNQVQRLVGQLRRMFEPGLATRSSGRVVLAGGEGYRLAHDVSGDLFDLDERLHDARRSGSGFHEVLRLLARQPFAGLDRMLSDHPWFVALERQRIAVATEALTTVTGAGGATDLVDLSEAITSKFPFEEALQAELILALAHVGRRSDALQRYDRIRRELLDELGVEPGPELRSAQAEVLHVDASPVVASGPAQLPMVLGGLVARPDAQRALDRIAEEQRAGGMVVVTAIGGMGGIAKTALAVAWAHELAPRFPDGQLYLNLRGFDPHTESLTPGEAITSLLTSLDAAASDVATDLETRAAHLRSVLSGRRVLLLLDNARDAEQVRPLLPGAAGCLVVVTSRNNLGSLVVRQGAVAVHLDRMTADEARALLVRRLGASAVDSDPRAVHAVLDACQGLPLALSVVATRVAMQPGLTLADVAGELERSELTRWSQDVGSEDLGAVFGWSYDCLSPRGRRAFRLLSAHPAAEMSRESLTSLLGEDASGVTAALDELCNASLLQRASATRFTFHDLVRAFARRKLDATGDHEEAERRVIDHFVQSARNVCDSAGRAHPRPRRQPLAHVEPVTVLGHDESVLWYTTEREAIDSVVRLALDRGHVLAAADITLDCRPVSQVISSPRDGADWGFAILRAADTASDPDGLLDGSTRADLHRELGCNLFKVNDFVESEKHLTRAIALAHECGDLTTQCAATRNFALLHELRGQFDDATRLYEEALGQARVLDSEQLQVGILTELGVLGFTIGDFEACLAACDTALAMAEANEWVHFVQVNQLNRAEALVALGRHGHALAAVQGARDAGPMEPAYVVSLHMLEATSALAVGLAERAGAAVERYRELRADPRTDEWDYLFVNGMAGLDARVDAVAGALAAEAPVGR